MTVSYFFAENVYMPTPDPSGLARLTTSGAEKLAASILADLYTAAKTALVTQIKLFQNKSTQKKLANRILALRLVKTVWQVESAVDLHDFYYRCSVLSANKDGRLPVATIDDLPGPEPIVIQGTIGQGKSILLRYLACKEFAHKKRIPVLLELRRLSTDKLLDYVEAELENCGFKTSPEVIDYLLKNNRVALLLDGFDEVPHERRSGLIDAIETLARRFPETRILVSARPDSDIQSSSLFRIVHLAPLQPDEYEGLIYRLCGDGVDGKQIVAAVRANNRVSALLSTPLMVTLLVFKYRVTQSVPENEAAFYAQLFELLLNRHDRTKPGFVRRRRSKLGDMELEQAFDALSFLTRRDNRILLPKGDLLTVSAEALKLASADASAADFAADIIEITCLIIDDKHECRFVHKSVQEYHAARWVRRRNDEIAKKFYTAMLDAWERWDQELRFLKIIDKYRFSKWFFLPVAARIFDCTEAELPARTIMYSDIASLFNGRQFSVKMTQAGLSVITLGRMPSWILRHSFPDDSYFAALVKSCARLPAEVQAGRLKPLISPQQATADDKDTRFDVAHILANGRLGEPLRELGRTWLEAILKEVAEASSFVRQHEETVTAFDTL